jgi:hypothetical protein
LPADEPLWLARPLFSVVLESAEIEADTLASKLAGYELVSMRSAVALDDRQVREQRGREQVERDRVAIRLGARQGDAIEQRGHIATLEAAQHHVLVIDDRDGDDALHGVAGAGVGRLRDPLRADHVRHRGGAATDLELRGLGALLDLRLDHHLLGRSLLGGKLDVDLLGGAGVDGHLHALAGVERREDAQLVLARR